MTRAERLRAHVAAADQQAVWGSDDCTAWAASWVSAEAGLARLIPRYHGEVEASRLIAAAGGLVHLWRSVLTPTGLVETSFPGIGDVGVVEARVGPVGVVFADGGYALWRAGRGVLVFSPRPSSILAAWTVPERR